MSNSKEHLLMGRSGLIHLTRIMIIAASIIMSTLANASASDAPSLGVSNTSQRPPDGSPIQIETCDAQQSPDSNFLVAKSDRRFKIAFTNEGSTTADLIRFRVSYGDEDFYIRDQGSFTSGVTITHKFRRRGGNVYSSPLFGHTRLTCSVDSAHFSDGSVWSTQSGSPNNVDNIPQDRNTTHPPLGLSLIETADGVRVSHLAHESTAEHAGFLIDDVIISINGKQISSLDEARTVLQQASPGSVVIVNLLRQKQPVQIKLPLPSQALDL